MPKFRIIPVIDILNSNAVHAIKGERKKYKLLKSKLFKSSNPIDIIKTLNENYSFNEFYIADLDSIINRKPNFDILSKILERSEVKLMLDPGIVDKDDIFKFSQFELNKLILGLETIKNLEVIGDYLNILGSDKLILSIDMYNGRLISHIDELNDENPFKIINKLKELELNEIILLDLFRVGQKEGGIPDLYLTFRELFKGRILIGGGIKQYKDIILEHKIHNFSGVLIATALYDGSINIKELKNNQKSPII